MRCKTLPCVVILITICSVAFAANNEKTMVPKHGPFLPGVIMAGQVLSRDKDGALRMPGKIVGAKCGFIDQRANFVLKPQFEDVSEFSEGLAGVRIKDKWGFVERSGNVLIAPNFDQVSEFHEGLCAVKLNGWWHYVEKTGKFAMAAEFAGLSNGNFKDGVAEVQPESFGKATRIDRKGNVLPEQTVFPVAEGLVRFKRNGKFGFRNEAGHEVIAPVFSFAEDFSEGLAGVSMPNYAAKLGYIDPSGKFVIPADYGYGASLRNHIFFRAACGRNHRKISRLLITYSPGDPSYSLRKQVLGLW